MHWELVEAFSAWQLGRAFSPATVRRRRVTLVAFIKHLRPADLASATGIMVEDFLSVHDKPRTRHAYRSDLAAFYRWACKRGLMPHNPVDQTDSIRVPRSLPRPVPPEMVPPIIARALDPRLQRILALAAYAGLRRAEISALRSDDVRLYPAPMIEVRNGKGAKDRTVPMHPVLRQLLAGCKGRIVPLGPDRIGKMAADHLRACGFDCTLHQLRHSFGTVMAPLLDGDLVELGKLMGHTDPSTTMGYVKLTSTRAAAAVEQAYTKGLRSAS